MPEWLNGAVSKTVVAFRVTVGSNPTLSAKNMAPPPKNRGHVGAYFAALSNKTTAPPPKNGGHVGRSYRSPLSQKQVSNL